MRLPRIEVDANLRTHHKTAALAVALQDPRAWTWLVELWMWASQNQPTGLIPGPSARLVVEYVLGWRGTPGLLVESLISCRWMDVTPDGLQIHQWEEHAGAHIHKAERDALKMKEYRGRVRERYGNVTVTESNESERYGNELELSGNDEERSGNAKGNHNHNHIHTSPEQPAPELVLSPPGQQVEPDELRGLWNDKAHQALPRCLELTKTRRPKARARLKERSLAEWELVIDRIGSSAFCRGETPEGWRADFDWLIKADTATKVLEGKYDRGAGPPTRAGNARFVQAQDIDKSTIAKTGTFSDF